MAVASEEYTGEQLSAVAGESMPTVERLNRLKSGSWSFRFRLAGEVTLPDGRIVAVHKRVRVRATEQIGRKPARATA